MPGPVRLHPPARAAVLRASARPEAARTAPAPARRRAPGRPETAPPVKVRSRADNGAGRRLDLFGPRGGTAPPSHQENEHDLLSPAFASDFYAGLGPCRGGRARSINRRRTGRAGIATNAQRSHGADADLPRRLR